MNPWRLIGIIAAAILYGVYACCVMAGRDDERNGRK
jgi:hypothetical protein